ncbi:hypothetical protein FOWG_16961 [Fusarium oxysporum f. sp. lycopersici MN25]|nr:hypothetical protein FOWG_16961 [Fusarium oxysporum f. sp. lycopersici MN25]
MSQVSGWTERFQRTESSVLVVRAMEIGQDGLAPVKGA